jgi:hypothetical protein
MGNTVSLIVADTIIASSAAADNNEPGLDAYRAEKKQLQATVAETGRHGRRGSTSGTLARQVRRSERYDTTIRGILSSCQV